MGARWSLSNDDDVDDDAFGADRVLAHSRLLRPLMLTPAGWRLERIEAFILLEPVKREGERIEREAHEAMLFFSFSSIKRVKVFG